MSEVSSSSSLETLVGGVIEGSWSTARSRAGGASKRFSHPMVRVSQLMSGFVSVSQLRPKMASHAESRGDIKNRVETRGVPSGLDRVRLQKWVIALARASPLNRRRDIGWSSLELGMLFLVTKSGDTKQSEAPESSNTRMVDEFDRSCRMKEFLSGMVANVANVSGRQFWSCNGYIELPSLFPITNQQ